MKIKPVFIRLLYLGYLFCLLLLLWFNHFSLGDLNLYYLFYFFQLYLVLELTNLFFKKLKLDTNIKSAYFILLIYIVINSLTLAFLPQLRNIIFNRLGHIISGVIFAIVSFELLHKILEKHCTKLALGVFNLFVFSLASTAGVFNEIIELVLDIVTKSHRIGPGFDTAIDLLMNTVGISLTILLSRKRKV